MDMHCICMAVGGGHGGPPPQGQGQGQGQRGLQQGKARSLKDIDLCEIVKRSQGETVKHNDYECHLKGEKRQNLINKLKMYLDDYDDRPVMKGRGKGGDSGKALGQSGFGPMIRYPGYVDYDHPYFKEPYNRMPELANTVGQRSHNPCTPMRTSDCASDNIPGGASGQSQGQFGLEGQLADDGRCHCAERRGDVPTCHAAQ